MEIKTKDFGGIINAAAKSPWGIFALMLLLISLTGIVFFQNESEIYKLCVWGMMFIGVVIFGIALVRAQLATGEVSSENDEKTEKKPTKPKKLIKPETYIDWLNDNYSHMDAEKLHGKGHAIPLSLPEIFIPLYAYEPVKREQQANEKSKGVGDDLNERHKPVDVEYLKQKTTLCLLKDMQDPARPRF
ncbi:MAG: hypothetical protein SVR08_15920 [Spirochaetota bacterium]|nr:hypothetical protein [Spirochaetota bacterium]